MDPSYPSITIGPASSPAQVATELERHSFGARREDLCQAALEAFLAAARHRDDLCRTAVWVRLDQSNGRFANSCGALRFVIDHLRDLHLATGSVTDVRPALRALNPGESIELDASELIAPFPGRTATDRWDAFLEWSAGQQLSVHADASKWTDESVTGWVRVRRAPYQEGPSR